MASVTLRGVHKRYGAARVVAGVDLHIPSGARCVLLGPSGCGKTTTLRVVAGLETPDEGVVELDGVAVANPREGVHVPPEKRGLSMVFQSYALWPHLSVAENVAYPLKRAGMSVSDQGQRIQEALATVHLQDLGARMPHALSGGQQQRVALARALAARPRVLLMDEPLSNLDARLRDGLRVEIAEICQAHGITLLHVTHDQAEALSLATLVAVMQEGRLAQLGSPQDVYSRPANLYVASFLGDTRVLRAVMGEAGAVQVANAVCHPRLGEPLARGAACALALRPEDVRLSDGEGALRGRVMLSSCVGARHLLDVETDAGTVRVFSPGDVAPKTPVGLLLDGGHAFAAA